MDPDQTLIRVHTVCLYAKCKFEKFARRCSRRHKQTTFSDAVFLGTLRVKKKSADDKKKKKTCKITQHVKGNGYTFSEDKRKQLSKLFFLPSEKGVHSFRSKFFPVRVDPFSEGVWCVGNRTGRHRCYHPYKKWWKICLVCPVSFNYHVTAISGTTIFCLHLLL